MMEEEVKIFEFSLFHFILVVKIVDNCVSQ